MVTYPLVAGEGWTAARLARRGGPRGTGMEVRVDDHLTDDCDRNLQVEGVTLRRSTG